MALIANRAHVFRRACRLDLHASSVVRPAGVVVAPSTVFASNALIRLEGKRLKSSKKRVLAPEILIKRFNPSRKADQPVIYPSEARLFSETGSLAHTLFSAAAEKNVLEPVAQEVTKLREVIANPKIGAVFSSRVHLKNGEASLTKILNALKLSPGLRQFIMFVYRQGLLAKTSLILNDFDKLWKDYNREVDATVITAVPLSERERAAFSDYIQEKFAKPGLSVVVHSQVDPSIIGGYVAKLGATTIDCSVKSEMSRIDKILKIKQELLRSRFI